MSARGLVHFSSLLIVPVAFAFFYALRVATEGSAIDHWLPKWWTLAFIGTIMVVERVYTYKYAVSQRSVLTRDILSTLVNVYVTAAATGMLLLPVLAFFPEYFLGRKVAFASPEQLGRSGYKYLPHLPHRQLLSLLDSPLATFE